MSLLILILSLFGQHTAESCNLCSWPYYATANQRGQCVKGVGLQSNLDNTCYNWCLMWASDVITTTGYVLISPSTSSTGTNCVCKRQTSSGPLEYMTRAQNSCPSSWMGPSDDEINSWKSSNEKTVAAQTAKTGKNMWELSSNLHTLLSNPINYDLGYMTMSIGTPNGTNDYQMILSNSNIASSQQVFQVGQGIAGTAYQTQNKLDSGFSSVNATLAKIGDTLATTLAVARTAATGSDLKQLGDDLKYSINTHSGGGSQTVDFTSVLDAITNGNANTSASLARLQESIDAQAGDGTNIDLTETNTKLDAIKAQSISNAKAITDNADGNYDKAAKTDADAAKEIRDYKEAQKSGISATDQATINGAGDQADVLTGQMTNAKSGLLDALSGFSNISNSCADGHISGGAVEFDIQGFHWKTDFDAMLNMSVPQKFLTLMRLGMRLVGAISGILVCIMLSKMLATAGRTSWFTGRYEGGSM